LQAPCTFSRRLARHRLGVTGIEYALIAALVAVTVVPTAASLGKQLAGLMHNVGASMAGIPLTELDPP
jgi:Flp pilus assembly pilin Flp